MHSFAAFRFDARRLTDLLGATPQGRALSYLPLAHIVERAGLEMPALLLGSRIFFTEGIETFLADLHRARPTIFLSVPRLLLKFQQGVFEKVSREKLDTLLRLPIIDRYSGASFASLGSTQWSKPPRELLPCPPRSSSGTAISV
jgi:long-subunit acyl-CoA synthetase (AMP-forming)